MDDVLLEILNEYKDHYVDSWIDEWSAGIRAEFRITGNVVRVISRAPDASIVITTNVEDGEHLPFYIFRAADVAAFLKSSINRWLVLVESIAL